MLYEINMYESRKEGYEEGLAEGKAEGLTEGKAKGLAEGKAEGLSEGKTIGIAEGKAMGIAEGKTELLHDLIRKFILSGKDTTEIMELLSVPEDMVSKVRESML